MKASEQQRDSLHNRNLAVVVATRLDAYDVIVRKKILVVEDDPDLVELLSFNLRACGFVVSTAGDGVEGVNKKRSNIPEPILVALKMAQLDGICVMEMVPCAPGTCSTSLNFGYT